MNRKGTIYTDYPQHGLAICSDYDRVVLCIGRVVAPEIVANPGYRRFTIEEAEQLVGILQSAIDEAKAYAEVPASAAG